MLALGQAAFAVAAGRSHTSAPKLAAMWAVRFLVAAVGSYGVLVCPRPVLVFSMHAAEFV